MNELKWNNRFNLGVECIDKAHQRLFAIVGKLVALNEDTEKQRHACREGIKYFKSYTLRHFAEEEAYMRSIDYSGYDLHKSLHDNMCNITLPALERELESQDYSVESAKHFLGICIGWLNGHIMIEDRAITGRNPQKWVHQPSADELDSLKKAVAQGFMSLFRLKAELISALYSGEDFSSGNVLCYRLNYTSQDKRVIQVFLIYEERMVLNVLSELLGKPIQRADKTVIYAFKMLSQQLMSCIGKHFTVSNEFQITKNDLLTFDQLLRFFDKEYPPYSVLFDVEGKGYFSLCIRP